MDVLVESSDVSVLDLLRRLGPQRISQLATAMGVTVTAVRQRLNRLTAQGFVDRRLVRSGCFELPFADHSFDTVVSSQVIGHIPYARSLFVEMNRVLAIDGTLVIGTSDHSTLAWRIIGRAYQMVLPYAYRDEHMTQYTRFRLTEELAQSGFAVVRYRYIAGGELIMECVKREDN